MLDINKVVGREALTRLDPEGHMYELDHWSPRVARTLASAEGIPTLTEEHWHVIIHLRDRHREHGRAGSAREIMRELEQEFAAEGGRRHLYALFPGGPVSQGCRIAGVPAPPYCNDPSFGSRE